MSTVLLAPCHGKPMWLYLGMRWLAATAGSCGCNAVSDKRSSTVSMLAFDLEWNCVNIKEFHFMFVDYKPLIRIGWLEGCVWKKEKGRKNISSFTLLLHLRQLCILLVNAGLSLLITYDLLLIIPTVQLSPERWHQIHQNSGLTRTCRYYGHGLRYSLVLIPVHKNHRALQIIYRRVLCSLTSLEHLRHDRSFGNRCDGDCLAMLVFKQREDADICILSNCQGS